MKPINEIAETIEPGKNWHSPHPNRKPTKAGIARLSDIEITHPQLKTAVLKVHEWAERKAIHQDASIVLAGGAGVGKTHIARAILWSIRYTIDDTAVSPVGRFWVANDLIQALDPHTRAGNLISNNLPMVVIDDIGSEQMIPYIGTDWNKQSFEKEQRYFKIIDHCYTWQISVIITTNLSISGLEECIGLRAFSRLQEMAPKGFMLELSEVPDYRRQTSGRR